MFKSSGDNTPSISFFIAINDKVSAWSSSHRDRQSNVALDGKSRFRDRRCYWMIQHENQQQARFRRILKENQHVWKQRCRMAETKQILP